MAQKRSITEAGAVHDEREIEAVVEVLRTTTLDLGPRVAEFEARIATLLGKANSVFVNSGTSALRLAIDLLGCERGDEIITPVVTFSADIAPMAQSGILPAFVDVEPDTYQIDAERIAEMIGPRTKAILAPNLVGNVPDWDRVRAVADEHGVLVVEDTCDVLGATLRGSVTGERADIVVTSFARTHAMTCAGNGGAVAVDDPGWHDATLVRRRWGRRSETYLFGSRQGVDDRFGQLADGTPYDLVFVFDDLGYNFEPSEIMAAYGLVQLEKLDEFNKRRQHNFAMLDDVMASHEGKVIRPRTTEGADTTWMRYPFLLGDGIDRTELQERLLEHGIATRMVWTGNILRQPGFAGIEHRAPGDGFPNADLVMERALTLPLHHALTSDDVGYLCEVTDELLRDL